MINWEDFDKTIVKIDSEREKTLTITEWRNDGKFQKPGIRMKVIEEDEKQVSKEFSTTSTRLIRLLRPIIEKADTKGISKLKLSITRIGSGFETNYLVKEL